MAQEDWEGKIRLAVAQGIQLMLEQYRTNSRWWVPFQGWLHLDLSMWSESDQCIISHLVFLSIQTKLKDSDVTLQCRYPSGLYMIYVRDQLTCTVM
jgi:hypothetical protein